MTGRKKRFMAGLLGAAVILGGCQGRVDQNRPDEPVLKKIRIGYHPNFGGSSVVSIGMEKGYFEEEGLDVELVKFTSGPPSIAALEARDIDVSFLGHGAYTLVIEGQADIIAVDCLSNAEEILVRADSGITSIEELAGKKLATQFETSGENFLDAVLQEYGMDGGAIELVNMDIAGCVTAFVDGKVDAVSLWAPYTNEVRERLGDSQVKTLYNCMDFKDKFALPMSWVATDSYIREHEDTVLRFLRALYRCMDYRADHLEETAALVARRLGKSESEILLDIHTGMWLTTEETKKLLADGTILRWYEEQQEFFQKKKPIYHARALKDFMRLDLVTKAIGE